MNLRRVLTGLGFGLVEVEASLLRRGRERRVEKLPDRGSKLRVFAYYVASEEHWFAESLDVPLRGWGATCEEALHELWKSLHHTHNDELLFGCLVDKSWVTFWYYVQLLEPVPWHHAAEMVFPGLSDLELFSPLRQALYIRDQARESLGHEDIS